MAKRNARVSQKASKAMPASSLTHDFFPPRGVRLVGVDPFKVASSTCFSHDYVLSRVTGDWLRGVKLSVSSNLLGPGHTHARSSYGEVQGVTSGPAPFPAWAGPDVHLLKQLYFYTLTRRKNTTCICMRRYLCSHSLGQSVCPDWVVLRLYKKLD